jgi:hypothetical protein
VSQVHPRAALRAARRFLSAAALAAAIGILGAHPVAAHGELIFQLGSERVAPGGVVEVRGDLGAGSTVEIVVISKADGTRRSIATLTDFEEGHFQDYVTIPADLPAGDYLVEAGTESIAVRAPLTVAGSAAGEGGERRDQDEPLLVPLPSGWAGYAFETPAAGVPLGPVPAASRETWPIPPVVIAGLLLLGAIVLLGGLRLATRARTRSRAA